MPQPEQPSKPYVLYEDWAWINEQPKARRAAILNAIERGELLVVEKVSEPVGLLGRALRLIWND